MARWFGFNKNPLRRWLVLAAFLAAAACVQAVVIPTPADITSISMERGCFGCTTGSVVTLRRDGSATFTTTGNARHATQTETSGGTVSAAEFEQLARLIVSQRFFELADSYDDPQVQDGAWSSTRVACGAIEKRVVDRNDAGPASLKAVESAIEGARALIRFNPERR